MFPKRSMTQHQTHHGIFRPLAHECMHVYTRHKSHISLVTGTRTRSGHRNGRSPPNRRDLVPVRHTFHLAHLPPDNGVYIRVLVYFRDERADTLIMARTDTRTGLGLTEALEKCFDFKKIASDIAFPQSVEGMQRYCKEVDGLTLANIVEVRWFINRLISAVCSRALSSQNSLCPRSDNSVTTNHLPFVTLTATTSRYME